jgi:hypothetical protein
MPHEIALKISDTKRLDTVILCLVHSGYDVYMGDSMGAKEAVLCFTVPDDEIQEIEYERKPS